MNGTGQITPPAGMGGEADPAGQGGFQGGDPQGGQQQQIQQGGPQQVPQGGDPQQGQQQQIQQGGPQPGPGGQSQQQQQAPTDPLATFRLPNGQLDVNALTAAYQRSQQQIAGHEKILADKVAEMNAALQGQQYAQPPQQQQFQQQQQQVNPYAQILQSLPEDSLFPADEYMRYAQIMEIAAARAMDNRFNTWSQRMQQQEQEQAVTRYNTTVDQVRNQFSTRLQMMALEHPEMATMENLMVQHLNSNPEFMNRLQQIANGQAQPFTEDEARQYLLAGRDAIMGMRQQVAQQFQQAPQVQQVPQGQQAVNIPTVTVPQGQIAPTQLPQQQQQPMVDEFGRPVMPPGPYTGQLPPQAQQQQQPFNTAQAQAQPQQIQPGTVPGVGLDPNYAAQVAAQGLDRTQQFQPPPQQMTAEEQMLRQRWAGYM